MLSWNDDIGVVEEINDGLGLYIEDLRNKLLKRELEYIDQLGLVEKV